jgi:hypothetical protein
MSDKNGREFTTLDALNYNNNIYINRKDLVLFLYKELYFCRGSKEIQNYIKDLISRIEIKKG